MNYKRRELRLECSRNMFLNHVGKPSKYLPACMIIWGVISILTGPLNLDFHEHVS